MPSRSPPFRFRSTWMLLAVVLLGAGIRLATLGRWSIWIDEAFTLHDAFDVLPDYPLYYLLARWTVLAFGDGPLALRALPCAFGVATLALLGGFRSRVDQERARQSLLAALLLALSSWHVFWSQSARYYAPLTFFVLVAFVAVASGRLRPSRIVVALLATAAAVLCHPTAAFFVPAMAAVLVVRLPPRARRIAIASCLMLGVVAVALYLPLFHKHVTYKGSASTAQLVSSYGFSAGPLLLLAAALGAWPGRGGRLPPELLFAAIPGALLAAASAVLFVTGYHAFATLPFVALLAARGVLRLRGSARTLLLVVLLLEQGAGLVLYHASHGMRPRYREAAAAMAAARARGALLFATQAPPVLYYLREGHRDLRTGAEVRFLDDWTLSELEAAAAAGPVAFLVHPDDLHDWDSESLERLRALEARPGARRERWDESFGPKELSVRVVELP